MNKNPFEQFQTYMNPENFSKFSTNWDFSNYSNILKGNAEVISSTNQMISETMQNVITRGSDSAQKNATEIFNSMKDAVYAGDMTQVAECGQKYLNSTIDNNVNNFTEMLDMTAKSSTDVVNKIAKNVKDNNKAFNKGKKQ